VLRPLPPPRRSFLVREPVDGGKGLEGLAARCRQALGDHPLDGAVYGFRTRPGTTLKLLAYEGQGVGLWTKRLSHGRVHWGPTATTPSVRGSAREVTGLRWKGLPDRAPMAPEWRQVASGGTSAAG
jgi:transposase